jgi:hypothetical protein
MKVPVVISRPITFEQSPEPIRMFRPGDAPLGGSTFRCPRLIPAPGTRLLGTALNLPMGRV